MRYVALTTMLTLFLGVASSLHAQGLYLGNEVVPNGTIPVRITHTIPGFYAFGFVPPDGYEFVEDSGETTVFSYDPESGKTTPGVRTGGEGRTGIPTEYGFWEIENSESLYLVSIAIYEGFPGVFNATFHGDLKKIEDNGTGGVTQDQFAEWDAKTLAKGLIVIPEIHEIIYTNTTKKGATFAQFASQVVNLDPANTEWDAQGFNQNVYLFNPRGFLPMVSPILGVKSLGSNLAIGKRTFVAENEGYSDYGELYVMNVDVVVNGFGEWTEENKGVRIPKDRHVPLVWSANDAGRGGCDLSLSYDNIVEIGTIQNGEFKPDKRNPIPLNGMNGAFVVMANSNAKAGGEILLTLKTPSGKTFIDTVAIKTGKGGGPDDPPFPPGGGPMVSLSVDNSAILEPGARAVLTATLNQSLENDLTVGLSLGGTATSGADYTIETTSITIPAGAYEGYSTITSIDDLIDEPNETVDAEIASVSNADVTIVNGQASLTIIDDDGSGGGDDDDDDPEPEFESLTVDLEEIEENGGEATFTLTLVEALDYDLSVAVSWSGDADQGTDYSGDVLQITIPANESSVSFTVTAIEDDIEEEDETVTAGVTSMSATTTIVDNTPSGELDLRVDMNHDGEINSRDDRIEDSDNYSGAWCLLRTAELDDDFDGKPDFADWTRAGDEVLNPYTEMEFEFSLSAVEFDYSASDPNEVTFDEETETYSPAQGALRIWTKAMSEARNPSSVIDGGDYVPPNIEISSDLLPDKLYIEGIQSGTHEISCKGATGNAQDTVKVNVFFCEPQFICYNNDTKKFEIADDIYNYEIPARPELGIRILESRIDDLTLKTTVEISFSDIASELANDGNDAVQRIVISANDHDVKEVPVQYGPGDQLRVRNSEMVFNTELEVSLATAKQVIIKAQATNGLGQTGFAVASFEIDWKTVFSYNLSDQELKALKFNLSANEQISSIQVLGENALLLPVPGQDAWYEYTNIDGSRVRLWLPGVSSNFDVNVHEEAFASLLYYDITGKLISSTNGFWRTSTKNSTVMIPIGSPDSQNVHFQYNGSSLSLSLLGVVYELLNISGTNEFSNGQMGDHFVGLKFNKLPEPDTTVAIGVLQLGNDPNTMIEVSAKWGRQSNSVYELKGFGSEVAHVLDPLKGAVRPEIGEINASAIQTVVGTYHPGYLLRIKWRGASLNTDFESYPKLNVGAEPFEVDINENIEINEQ